MALCALFILIGVTLSGLPASAQFQVGPTGDFRVEGRPGTVPNDGLPGVPSLSPGPSAFRDTIGGRMPADILKGIDKDLEKSLFERSDSVQTPGSRSIELERQLSAPAEQLYR
jgi:hypothetical protein